MPTHTIQIKQMTTATDRQWYALRVTYNREMKVKQELEGRRLKCFLPLTHRIQMRGERRIKVLVPAIHNLIFLNASREEMEDVKAYTSLPIRYIMDRERNVPVVVPEKQMKDFIAVAGSVEEQVVYLEPDVSSFAKGDRVRVTGGLFEGTEGYFVRVRGDRRVVVCIPGIAAVATTFIHPSLVEKIE